MHRIHASPSNLSALVCAVRAKLGLPAVTASSGASDVSGSESGGSGGLLLHYDDDEGDRVVLSSDDELVEAVALATRAVCAKPTGIPTAPGLSRKTTLRV